MNEPVAVTGTGVYCALGDNTDAFWRACLDHRTVVEPIPDHWSRYADYHSRLWSPLPALDFDRFRIGRVERLQTDPVSLIAAIAAHEALSEAGLAPVPGGDDERTLRVPGIDPERIGVFLGTGVGGVHSLMDSHTNQVMSRSRKRLVDVAARAGSKIGPALDDVVDAMHHGRRFNPFIVSMLMPNAVSAFVGIRYGLEGPNETLAVACASGTCAIGAGLQALRAGDVDVALCGGSEYLVDHYGSIFRGFDIARTLVRDCDEPLRANRPFDRHRSGFLYSQGGAALMVLERHADAAARGRTPYAEVAGFGLTFDAHSMMNIAPDGLQIQRAIGLALNDAGIEPQQVDYINTHGTGTEANDRIEAAVLERLFGSRPAVNATKSLLGHTVGASGAIEAVVTALSLRDQATHGCLNLEEPIADLGFLRDAGSKTMRTALSHSLAFGGHNAALVLRRFHT